MPQRFSSYMFQTIMLDRNLELSAVAYVFSDILQLHTTPRRSTFFPQEALLLFDGARQWAPTVCDKHGVSVVNYVNVCCCLEFVSRSLPIPPSSMSLQTPLFLNGQVSSASRYQFSQHLLFTAPLRPPIRSVPGANSIQYANYSERIFGILGSKLCEMDRESILRIRYLLRG
ncbi:hypothetical protein CEXT_343051 [Caerostris extrusa]|uniref:Uncharacterized protein n=1 Tax=Caerostris extrusa TaxID=172846 RepID=A0AAV4SFN1_CAEEX|nr:hypothetical protein CEXT_343051 [Caerostris extrusa]